MTETSNNSSTQKPTPEEIQAHLHELNLATDIKLKEQRQEWFRKQRISVRLVQGTFFLVPECTDPKQVLEHLAIANIHLSMLADELSWFKEHRYVVKLEKQNGRKKYVFVEELPPEVPPQTTSPATVQKEDE